MRSWPTEERSEARGNQSGREAPGPGRMGSPPRVSAVRRRRRPAGEVSGRRARVRRRVVRQSGACERRCQIATISGGGDPRQSDPCARVRLGGRANERVASRVRGRSGGKGVARRRGVGGSGGGRKGPRRRAGGGVAALGDSGVRAKRGFWSCGAAWKWRGLNPHGGGGRRRTQKERAGRAAWTMRRFDAACGEEGRREGGEGERGERERSERGVGEERERSGSGGGERGGGEARGSERGVVCSSGPMPQGRLGSRSLFSGSLAGLFDEVGALWHGNGPHRSGNDPCIHQSIHPCMHAFAYRSIFSCMSFAPLEVWIVSAAEVEDFSVEFSLPNCEARPDWRCLVLQEPVNGVGRPPRAGIDKRRRFGVGSGAQRDLPLREARGVDGPRLARDQSPRRLVRHLALLETLDANLAARQKTQMTRHRAVAQQRKAPRRRKRRKGRGGGGRQRTRLGALERKERGKRRRGGGGCQNGGWGGGKELREDENSDRTLATGRETMGNGQGEISGGRGEGGGRADARWPAPPVPPSAGAAGMGEEG